MGSAREEGKIIGLKPKWQQRIGTVRTHFCVGDLLQEDHILSEETGEECSIKVSRRHISSTKSLGCGSFNASLGVK
jgi:hypothetical protein